MKYRWWKSKHRWVYLLLSIEHFITPRRIQLFAHGMTTLRNRKIYHSLKKRKVLTRRE